MKSKKSKLHQHQLLELISLISLLHSQLFFLLFRYACYLTMIKHKVPNQKQMDIPMFFGKRGIFYRFVLSKMLS